MGIILHFGRPLKATHDVSSGSVGNVVIPVATSLSVTVMLSVDHTLEFVATHPEVDVGGIGTIEGCCNHKVEPTKIQTMTKYETAPPRIAP